VNDLKPSTPIGSLSGRQLRHVLDAASEIAPEIVPYPTIIHSRRQRIGSWVVIISMLAALVALARDADSGAYILSGAGAMLGLMLNQGRPDSVTLDSYVTVGELAAAAGESRVKAY
jgi:hypothetical protein